jgi:Restriction endonuclease/Topoisomerase DNA binding C4 zinc finger
MKNRSIHRSILEDILETAFKNPVAGVVISIFFAGLGLYFASKEAPAGAKPADMIFLPAEHMFGKVCYLLSGIVLILAGIGYVVTSVKRKHWRTTTREEISYLSKNPVGVAAPASKAPQFKTKEDYFRWKESAMKNSSDNHRIDAVPESRRPSHRTTDFHVSRDMFLWQDQNEEPVANMQKEEILWTFDSIYDALSKIDWYQFEKFSEALLMKEGYTVERRGGAHPDGGVDLIATKDSGTILVQCKHWKTWEIKPKTVREMVGTMKINHADSGALKGGSKAVQQLATQQGIEIQEGNDLAVRALSRLSQEQLKSILKADVHHCPKCEAEMVWREGKVKPFWGCSRYPRCRGKLEYTGAR